MKPRLRRNLTLGLALILFAAGMAMVTVTLLDITGPEARPKPAGPDSTLAGFQTQIPPPGPDDGSESGGVEPSNAALARLRAPSVAIDAPVEVLGLDASGVMANPSGPEVVAWYDFSSRPGFGGNAVFAGHLDYANYGPAIFWRLRELQPLDQIIVDLEDGTSLVYTVLQARTYDAATAPVGEIVGPTEGEMITLITCAGKFDRRTRQYEQRLIVRAARS